LLARRLEAGAPKNWSASTLLARRLEAGTPYSFSK
jgi:hypothetical protein